MSNKYDASSIQHLETREAMRTRIQAYLGSDDTEGIYQAFKEIINNSTDEALAGYGNEIYILLNEEKNEVIIKDMGRGVPFSTANGRNVLVEIYTESHTGGKFDKNAYKNSSGLNGLGATAVCMSSEYFIVKSQRDNKIAMARFYQGTLEEYTEDDYKTDKTGTTVIFKPDKEVFKNMTNGYSYERICDEIKNIAYLNKGVKFIVENTEGQKTEFYSENGIADFIKDKVSKPLMKKPIIVSKSDGVDEVEVAFIWSGDKAQSYTFVNGLFCVNGGSTDTGARTAITNGIKKILGKVDIEPDIIRRGLVYAVNCKVLNPSFSNQVKDKVVNPSLRSLTQQAFKQGLEEFSTTSECNAIIEMIKKFQKAEKAADRAREAIMNQNRETEKEAKKKTVMGGKLKDCRIHDENSCLYIVEGDSALGSFTASRDSTYVAAMPIRGKIINALKNPIEKVLENEEVQDIAKACGCGILDNVNVKKLRYGKICFAADADPDGYAIVCLLLVLFYVLMPELITTGHVYWAQFPLYEITNGNELLFAYDDIELEQMLKKYPKAHYDRNKGIGEMGSEAFSIAAFGENARLIQFTMEDVNAATTILEILLGKKNEERTEYIFENVDFSVVEGE